MSIRYAGKVVAGGAGNVPPLYGTTDPTTSTRAEFLGQIYVNTTNHSAFICVEINDDVYTWEHIDNVRNRWGNIVGDIQDQLDLQEEFDTKADVTDIKDGILTIQRNGQTLQTFSANQMTNVTVDVQDPTYIHEQGVASDTWTIYHNLNKYPSITIVDTAENIITGAIQYVDTNTCIVLMNSASKGKAYLN